MSVFGILCNAYLGFFQLLDGEAQPKWTIKIEKFVFCYFMSPWRNRLARSAVNRKVGGSSPPGDGILLLEV